ncbi:nuclear receptor subfamily 5 group A member 2-like isoform 1-T1 [Odontesthes bonariensis]|uniref:nuclear receptor subfamily 5 group A member 2-like isoform X1 n=2 Tax=Odontesthes bonariensis TaxID=219752 RepID=UPI003F5822CD
MLSLTDLSSRMECRYDVGLEELCPVCGDKVSGYHYGLLTCESCKGFFKRTVQNNKTYACAENQQCRIDKTQRKRCPFCRFQKCLHVGMRLEAVRSDRMRGGRNKFGPIYKRDRALKQQKKALIQACRFNLQSSSPLTSTTHQRDCISPGGFHSVAILHSTLLNIDQASSMSSFLPPNSPGVTQHQCISHSNNCAGSIGLAAGIFIDPLEPHSRLIFTQGPTMSQLVMEFLSCDPDELQLQKKITARLQQEQKWHRDSNTFSPIYPMVDQLLCSIVEWARTSIFFKQLKVNDQMKLLHHSWGELLVLDIISRQVIYGKEGSLRLVTGQEVELSNIVSHAGPTVASLTQRGKELVERLNILKVDRQEFACIKFLILFNPDVKELEEHGFVVSVLEQVEGALLEYTLTSSPHHPSRFTHLLLCLSELRSLSTLAEDYLYCRHLIGEVPSNNLLNEMLHAKYSCT